MLSELLRLRDERSTAFRAAVASAPGLDTQGRPAASERRSIRCGTRARGVAPRPATVAAGPAAARPVTSAGGRPGRAAGARALREAGPDRGRWTWWGDSRSPRTCGAAARHQLQEIAVHAYDARVTASRPPTVPVAGRLRPDVHGSAAAVSSRTSRTAPPCSGPPSPPGPAWITAAQQEEGRSSSEADAVHRPARACAFPGSAQVRSARLVAHSCCVIHPEAHGTR
ncbi:maleylpyruvate isomerase N-terminal domain-containing protein [Streptomyces tricolor]|uniref:maleylpyruvate isomerase N-terminal domain-containing protein n=1 Tax=Streptomyces tricolor TaxID=68277 RepID=UPI0036E6A7F9